MREFYRGPAQRSGNEDIGERRANQSAPRWALSPSALGSTPDMGITLGRF